MAPRFQIGQKVSISPSSVDVTAREAELQSLAGFTGEIKDFYWLEMDRGVNLFYVYTVRVEQGNRELVLHEDELEPALD